MITEEQKYYSGVMRTMGFAFLTPFGSIIFQVIVFKKYILESNLFVGIILCVIGFIMLYLGTLPIKEKK